jgi:hypothetical protein
MARLAEYTGLKEIYILHNAREVREFLAGLATARGGTGLRPPQRVAVIGPQTSGKTALAPTLGARWGLPVVHLDDLLIESVVSSGSWTYARETDTARQRALVAEEAAKPGWLLEGCYWRTLDILVEAADLVVFIDPPMIEWLSRTRTRGWDGIVAWVRRERSLKALWFHLRFLMWQPWYPLRERPRVLRALRGLEQGRVVRLRGQRDVDRFVAGLTADRDAGPG